MKKTVIIHFCVLFVLGFSPLLSNFSYSAGLLDKEQLSYEQFVKVFYQYQAFSSLEAGFTQNKILPDLQMTLKSQGNLKVTNPHTVVWEIVKPAYMKAVIKGRNITMQYGKGKDKKLENWSFDQAPTTASQKLAGMLLWLQFDMNALYSKYSIVKFKDLGYKFMPKNKDSLYSLLEINMHKQGYIEHLKMMERSGDVIDLRFTRVKIVKSNE